MRIAPISKQIFSTPIKPQQSQNENISVNHNFNNGIEPLSGVNKSYVSFKAFNGFKIGLSPEELERRTQKDTLTSWTLIDEKSEAYKTLKDGDKKALVHLVKAARILEDVYLRQDNPKNIPFKKYLEKEVKHGNQQAKMALTLFNAQKGINGEDCEGETVSLLKNAPARPGKGFYPQKLTEKGFAKTIKSMLENNESESVRKMLNQHSMVVKTLGGLKGVDYTEFFKKEFRAAADEIDKAAETATDPYFAEYLTVQARALRENNPLLDARADMFWAQLEDTPLEFTIVRESYDDRMTPSLLKDEEIKTLLKNNGIEAFNKDTLGVRVGIVNKEGTKNLFKIKPYLSEMAEQMPFKDEYEQFIKTDDKKQSMVDVDIVDMTGHMGAYRGAISIASNLPNNDKLSVRLGGGKKNVYHIQPREYRCKEGLEQRLDAILDPSQHKYYHPNGSHQFTILHENVHSLGPRSGTERLGIYKNVIEENKADMGALVMLDYLTEKGFYTKDEKKQVITTFITNYMFKAPDFESAHRRRNIMQNNMFIQNGAIDVNDDGVMKINYDKVISSAKDALAKIVRLQIDGDFEAAEAYVKEYSVWTDELEKIGRNLKKVDKRLNSSIKAPLADKLLDEN